MPLAEQLVRQRYVHPGPLVLGSAPIKYPAPTTDRDRTVSRRSEPSSRTALIGAVSYTHLDVYKRQGQASLDEHPHVPRPAGALAGGAVGGDIAEVALLAPYTAVSYTHLDVYKRQTVDSASQPPLQMSHLGLVKCSRVTTGSTPCALQQAITLR